MLIRPFPPTIYRIHVFIDGQNLFLTAKECFGYKYPNYDPIKLANALTNIEPDRKLVGIHFYTGVHAREEDEFLHDFWMNKLQGLRRASVEVHYRLLKYTEIRKANDSSGETEIYKKPREKGIDVKIALDLTRLGRRGQYDIALIFSQDTDLNEAVYELYEIRDEFNRWMKFECAYPFKEGMRNPRGLDRTTWRKISKELYDQCLDERDYRPKPKEKALF